MVVKHTFVWWKERYQELWMIGSLLGLALCKHA
jgi:hypothetical protein